MKSIVLSTLLLTSLSSAVSAQDRQNANYVDYPELSLIERDLSGLDRVYRRHYHKFIPYQSPNGGNVLLVATDDVSDEQLLRAYGILGFYLTDVPGAEFGADKTPVANAMAENGAVLVMPGGADGDSPISERALAGQPLYALEFPIEGSAAYINNDFEQRDAGFEEIFHMVHDYGIGTRSTDGALKTTYQANIQAATEHAMKNGLWGNGAGDWISELADEGSLEQEYIAAIIDSYFGYWGAWTEGPGGMWDIYVAKTRQDVMTKDPLGAALMPEFLSKDVTYMARIDPSFSGVFELGFDPSQPYTNKSQYLVNARLLGDLPSGLFGNNRDNVLIGNAADNVIDGRDGIDVVQYPFASTDVAIAKTPSGLTVSGPAIGSDTLRNIEILRFTDRDITTDTI